MNEDIKAEIRKLLNDEFKAELLKAVHIVCLGKAIEINDEIIRPVYESWKYEREPLKSIYLSFYLGKEIMAAQDEVRKANPEIYESYISSIDNSMETIREDNELKDVITTDPWTPTSRLLDRLQFVSAKEATRWLCYDCIFFPTWQSRFVEYDNRFIAKN